MVFTENQSRKEANEDLKKERNKKEIKKKKKQQREELLRLKKEKKKGGEVSKRRRFHVFIVFFFSLLGGIGSGRVGNSTGLYNNWANIVLGLFPQKKKFQSDDVFTGSSSFLTFLAELGRIGSNRE